MGGLKGFLANQELDIAMTPLWKDILTASSGTTVPPIFKALLYQRLQQVHDESIQANTSVYEVSGGREQIIRSLLVALETLVPGDAITGLSTEIIWLRRNLGPDGRIITMLKKLVAEGISLNWCMLVDQKYASESGSPETQEIIFRQQQLFRFGEERGANVSLAVRYVDSETIHEMRDKKESFILLKSPHSSTLIAPEYSAPGQSLRCLRFWSPPQREEFFLRVLEGYVDLPPSKP
ncbi:MAG: hypothetical protein KDA78_12140 [Planctomycetaceae bacterium]|nr:hypothetical protein [Planctomycetaceae bacterium]